MTIQLPADVRIKDQAALEAAVLQLVQDAKVFGLAGSTNLDAVRCKVEGLTLGHWKKVWAALGDDVIRVLDENDKARTEDPAMTPSTNLWQPMATAPKDGTIIDLWNKRGFRVAEVWWDAEDECWTCLLDDVCFSHWSLATTPAGERRSVRQGECQEAR